MRHLTFRRALLAGATALLLGVSALGLALAQTPPTPTRPTGATQTVPPRPGHQAFLDALARNLGVTTERLQQAITAAHNEVGGPGFGHGGPRGLRGPRRVDLSVAAQAIGITLEQLRQELPGKSLAQVAQAHGRNPADVATALRNAASQRIDQAVANGRMTAGQGAQAKARIAQHIDELMNRVLPTGGPGSGTPGPGFLPGGPGPRPFAPGGTPSPRP